MTSFPSVTHEDVERLLFSFVAAWNRHDATGMAVCWIEEGDLKTPFGRMARGWRELEALLREEHQTEMARSSLSLTILGYQEIAPGVVVADVEGVLRSVRAPNGASFDLRPALTIVALRAPALLFAAVRAFLRPM